MFLLVRFEVAFDSVLEAFGGIDEVLRDFGLIYGVLDGKSRVDQESCAAGGDVPRLGPDTESRGHGDE